MFISISKVDRKPVPELPFRLFLSYSLLGSAKSSLEAVMYREVRRMFNTQSDSSLCC